MSIIASEIVWRKTSVINDGATNGGRMTATELVSGVKNNIWDDVPQAVRIAGETKYRKAHIQIANADSLSMLTPKVFIETITPGDDAMYIIEGTSDDTEATRTSVLYGTGAPSADITTPRTAGTTFTVVLENAHSSNTIFRVGDQIRISDRLNVNDTANNEEFLEIATVSNEVDDGQHKIDLTFTTDMVNPYTASLTTIASVIEPGDIAASNTAPAIVPAGALGDRTWADNIVLDSIGTMEIDWKLVFTSATQFQLYWDVTGGGSFVLFNSTTYVVNSATEVSPTNTSLSNKPYFTMDLTAVAGGSTPWEATDEVTFTTSPAALGLWYMRVIPANADSLSGDLVIVGITGESE